MFSRLKKTFQANQPIHLTGILRHTMIWVMSGINDLIYQNPNFRPTADGKGTVLVCVHGTADRVDSFKLVAERIVDRLPDSLQSIHLAAFDNRAQGKDIKEFAKQLNDKIVEAGYENIILLGHSRGVLVSADFAEYFAANSHINVKGVISVCGPFGGSDFALPPLSYLSTSVDQMKVDSQYLTGLCDKISKSSIPYHYFAAEKDTLVSIRSACIPEHRDSLMVLDRHGHLSILSSHRLVQHLAEIIPKMISPELENDINFNF